jgi:hypothetical protein
MNTGEIMDGAFQLYRRHFAAFLAAGALPLVPLLGFWAWTVWQAWRGVPLTAGQAATLTTFQVLAGWLPAVLTRGLVIHMADAAQMGRPVRFSAAVLATVRRYPALLWASGLTNVLIALPFIAGSSIATGVLVGDAMGNSVFFVIMASYVAFALCSGALAAAWFGTLPAVMLERTSGNAGRGRSWTLTRGGLGRVLAVWAIGFALVWFPWVGVEALLTAFTVSTDAGLPFAVSALLCQATGIFSIPLVAAARTLLFNDLRVRVEALDVRLLTERLTPAAA